MNSVPRNVAVNTHPLHPLFKQWCRKVGRPVNRESGIVYAQTHAALIARYNFPHRA